MIWYGVCYVMVWCDVCGMVWYGVMWRGVVCYVMLCYGMVCYVCNSKLTTTST